MVSNKENLKIHIIDDDEFELELLESILTRMGFQNIVKSNSSEEAIRLIQDHPPDLFFIDIMMPGMSGDEFRGLLKENPATKDIPVIFISGIISRKEEKEIGGRFASGDLIIAKPFSIERIAQAIVDTLGQAPES